MLFRLIAPLILAAGAVSAAPLQAPPARAASEAGRDPVAAAPLRFESLGANSPLSLGVISALAQDPQGLMWIGTSAGLLRYDGYNFRAQTAVGAQSKSLSFVRSLLVARDGRLWIGTEADGLAVLDPRSERLQFFRNGEGRPDGIAPGTLRALAQDRDGRLWVGTIGHGLDRYDPDRDRFDHVRQASGLGLPDDRVQALLVDREGTLWVGTWRGLARRVAGSERFEPVRPDNGEPDLAEHIVLALFEAPDGQIWVGTQQGELALVDPRSGRSRRVPADARLRGAINSFVLTPAGEVWVGRTGGLEIRRAADGALLGLERHDPERAQSLAGNEVRALLRDRAGWLWVGGYGGGLQRHNPGNRSLQVLGRERFARLGSDLNVRSVAQLASGEVWLGTNESGVYILDAQLRPRDAIRPQAEGGVLPPGRVSSIAQAADGTVWLGHDAGLHQIDARHRVLRVLRAGPGRARRLLVDAQQVLWIGTQDGLYRLGPAEREPQRVLAQGGTALTGDVNALIEDPARGLWVGTEKGLFLRPRDGGELLPLRSVAPDDLGHPSVVGLLLARDGTLWVDTAAGLHRLRALRGQEAVFERVGARHGVSGRAFGANLLEDERGRIWTQQFVYDPARDRHDELTPADGADLGTGWYRGYAQLRDGRMLFGGAKGVLVVAPEQFEPWRYQPPLAFTELRIDGRRAPLAGLQPELTLAPQARGFSVEFAALDYSDPTRNRYAYRLDGFDTDWTQVGADQRVASYSNLDPGEYRLQVRGTNRSGAWSPQELDLPVRVLPHWWQTWWARALALAALLALMYAWILMRTRYLRAQQAALEQRVRERTAALEAMSSALQRKTVELEESSLSDPLTGMRNRRFLTQQIGPDVALSLARHEATRQPGEPAPHDADLLFFLIDLDHFKEVNDELGHAAGDAVLRQIRARLQPVFRETDHLMRWGGEEFLIVARSTTRAHAAELAERARQQVASQPFDLGDGQWRAMTCSVGFACFPLDPEHPRDADWNLVVALADQAMYAAKHGGRDGWVGVLRAQARESRRAGRRVDDWLRSGELEWTALRPQALPVAPVLAHDPATRRSA